MHWKNLVIGIGTIALILVLIGVGIYAISITSDHTVKEHKEKEEKNREMAAAWDQKYKRGGVGGGPSAPGERKDYPADERIKTPLNRTPGDPAKCSELKPLPGVPLTRLAGRWILQEKLEFPEGMHDHNVIQQRDQRIICLRTEAINVTDVEATLKTHFYYNGAVTKNFTGFVKVKPNGHWNFHMLAKDHDGIMIDAVVNKYFVFVECLASKKFNSTALEVPGSVFVYTKGTLVESDMTDIRARLENMLRHNDETFLDFGEYCYEDAQGYNNDISNNQNTNHGHNG